MAGVEFFAFLGITSFWILFLSQNGMSLWQIGLLESIFHTTSLLCEIPSGMLADRYSYKTNLYLSRIAGIVSSVLMLAGQGNFWIYEQLQALSHSYLPQLYAVSYTEDETIVWEEYITGKSLEQIPATEKQVTKWLFELCDVLRFLHQHHILHRDIKPSNLLLGSDGHIRLIDFDAAREEKEQAEMDTRLLGTRGYAPPEQYGFAQTDERADIYALGVTAKELLGKAAKKRRWKHILKKCTALEPKKRYHHIWQITWAIRFGQIRRRLLYPLVLAWLALVTGFAVWGYATDADFRLAINFVLFTPDRDFIFRTVDIKKLEQSDVELYPFSGNTEEIYNRLTDKYRGYFISTGYCTEDGELLFGMFAKTTMIETGEDFYSEFQGLCYLPAHGDMVEIPPEECEPYAPAVLKLYHLKVFDDRIF